MPSRPRRIAVFVAASLLAAIAARAEPAATPIAVELNKLDAADVDCRATMLVTNGTDLRLDSLKLELVVFDANGVAGRRLAAEFGPLSKGKTVVKAFPVAGIGCAAISRVLLNGVLACGGAAQTVDGCVDLVAVASRASAPLVK